MSLEELRDHLDLAVSLFRKGVRSIVDMVDRAVEVNLNGSTNGGIINPAVSTVTSC